jgi:hypothetical protein
MKVWLGIDNGVSGQVGIIREGEEIILFKTPIRKCLNYQKKKSWLNRVDGSVLKNMLMCGLGEVVDENVFCLIERPLVNPGMFNATLSAVRALEATLIALESTSIPFAYIDSKEWQKALLPSGLRGPELKVGSLQVAKRLYPSVNYTGFKDADGLLIAHYAKMKYGVGI